MNLIESKDQLESWGDYLEFLKLQLKLLEGGAEPFFVSKDKLDFEIEGKPWKGHAVLAGPKGLACTRKLMKEGLVFREASCRKAGKELQLEGLDPKLAKEAAKTLAKMRLGFKIAGAEAELEGESGSEGSGPAAAHEAMHDAVGDLAKQATRIAKAVEVWTKTEAAATKELRKLQKALLALGDPRTKPVIQGLESILTRIDRVDDEAKAVEAAAGSGDAGAFGKAREEFLGKLRGILSHVEGDELIRMADSNPVAEVKIGETFKKSLSQLIQSV